MSEPSYTVGPNPHSRYPVRWWCRLTVRATAIVGDTSTRPCPADGIATTDTAAHEAARAHLAAAHPDWSPRHHLEHDVTEPTSDHQRITDETGLGLGIGPVDQAGTPGVVVTTSSASGVHIRPADAEFVIAAIRRGCGLDTAPDLDQVRTDLAAIARIDDDNATVEELADVDPALRRLLAEHAPRLVVEVERTRAATTGTLGLGPIIADHYMATTDPNCSDGVMLWPATERAAAVSRILDRHVLALLAEVTMRHHDIGELTVERDQLGAALDRVDTELKAIESDVAEWVDDYEKEAAEVLDAVSRIREACEEPGPAPDADHPIARLVEQQQHRRFYLDRDVDVTGASGTGRVADGVLWPDGTASLRWRSEHPSTVHWDHMADAERIHGHGGATRIVWIDA